MIDLVIIIHALVCLGIIGFILLQQGKGSELGAAMGAGASQSVFGAQGSANFLSRTTAILATIFFVTSVSLTMLVNQQVKRASLVNQFVATQPVSGDSQASEDLPPMNSGDSTLPRMPQ